ncbi:MAG: PD-(D/E)XK nuclease family protein [Betaproteobacteria bacterium]|nr:PD-(D/E)XK nuclease family protein [Betaproteobacteria bacterium]
MNISATRINRWESCRLAYKFHYIDMMPQARADHLELGTVVHSALEKVGKMLAEGKQPMTVDGLNAYKEAYQHSGLSGLTLFGEGQAMVGKYLDAQNPWPTVNHAELGFNISIPGTEHQLTGFIDRVDLTERGLEVIDYKTGHLIPTFAEVNASLQLRLYAAALRSLYWPQKAWPARLVLLRHGIEQTVTYTDRDLDEALWRSSTTWGPG